MTDQQSQYPSLRLTLPSLPSAQQTLPSPPLCPPWYMPQLQSPSPTRSRLPTHAERRREAGHGYSHRRRHSRSSRSVSPQPPRSPRGGRARSPRSPRSPRKDNNVLDEPLPSHISDLIARIQPTPRTGPWDEAEDQVLLYFVDGGRNKNWVRIAGRMSFRTAKQCRERYFQSLRPGISHAACTADEARVILNMVDSIGTRWADIARHLGNRSDNWVKNWWNGQRNERSKAKNAATANAGPEGSTGPTAGAAVPSHPATLVQQAATPTVPRAQEAAAAADDAYYVSVYDAQQKAARSPPIMPSNDFRQSGPPQQPYAYTHDRYPSNGYDRYYDRRPSLVPPPSICEASPHPSSRNSEAGSPGGLDWSSAASLASTTSLSLAPTPNLHSPPASTASGYGHPFHQHYTLPPANEIVRSLDDLERRLPLMHRKAAPEKRIAPMSLSNILN